MKLPLKAEIFKKIVSEINDGIVFLNRAGRIIYFNKAFLKLSNFDKKLFSNKEFDFKKDYLSTFSQEDETHYSKDSLKLYVYSLGDNGYSLIKVKKKENLDNVYSNFESILDPVATINLDGGLEYVNKAFKKLFLFEEFGSSENFQDYLKEKESWEKLLASLKIAGNLTSFELEISLPNESIKYFSCNVSNNKISRKEGVILHLRDISTEKVLKVQNKISELNYNRLFEIITSSIIIVDETGHIINMNQSAEELFGYSREELRLENYDKHFKVGRNRPSIQEIIEETRTHGGRFIEIGVSRRNKSGSYLYTYATYSLLEFGQKGSFVIFVMEKDLTPRIKLEKKLKNTVVQVKETQNAAIIGFAKLTEYRDHITGTHLERIREYTRYIAKSLQEIKKYKDYINDEYIEDLALSSVLHDIGKVGIEDSILLKAGKLSEEEYGRMKEHCKMGGEALSSIDTELGHQSFLTLGREVAHYHHERWDGDGYPEGLKGSDIPLSARIISIADVYDALTSERPYKSAFSHEEALKIIIKERGCQFDPEIVDVFIEIEQKIKRIREIIE